jgi:hypothetical protein
MNFVRCKLPHPLFLVLPGSCLALAARNYPGLPFPTTAAEVEADFLEAAGGGPLVLVDDRQPDRLIVSFCTPRYELVCGLTPERNGYSALRLSPLGLRSHNQIARGAVRLVTPGWGFCEDLAEFNRQFAEQAALAQTGLEAILAAWKQARQPAPAEPGPVSAPGQASDELAFLANVDTLIDLACQVELEQAARQERTPVKGIEAASAQTYRFQLAAPAGFRPGEYLQVGTGAAVTGMYDGVVVVTEGSSLILRFYQPVDFGRLQKAEWLQPKISTRQYTIQHAAVNALRNGESLNPHLLPLIVGNQFAAYPAPVIATGEGRPNPAQKTLIERALLVPDLLLALGPPGTGKTDTIRAIVAREAALGKKVLVTSKNNKAVDNVLEGLKNVLALRIGREEVVSPEVRPLLIDNLAGAMRGKILGGIEPVEDDLERARARWPQIQAALAGLSQLAADWRQAQIGVEQRAADLANWQAAAHLRIGRLLERQRVHLGEVNARLIQASLRAEALRQRLEALEKPARLPLVGAVFILLADRLARDWDRAFQEFREARQELRRSRDSLRQTWEAYRQFVTAGEPALQHKRALLEAEAALAAARTRLDLGVETFSRLTESLPGAPRMPKAIPSSAALEAALAEWGVWQEGIHRRRGLLQEWRTLLETRHQTLYPALIRRAEVVGATCIGVATDARFEDLDFDLVIADEAGQIQVMDLLVPLVRAKRAVLVGDHLQLPPVVETEIVTKLRETEPENQELGEWLEKSLFERLIERPETPASHRVMLDTQYRMPRPIADFISGQFYGGNYHTGQDLPHTDPFFSGSPLVFVDTQKEFRHFEQRAEDGQGYSNPQEAGLISDLVLAYQSKGVAAGVIVPYKKQAEVIRRELRRRQSGLSEEDLVSRVATVDSFQGKERDVILFSFTRSNTEGRIGFLTELRRLNVSLTRARRQLVLVGDAVTLSGAADKNFARLFQALLESVKKNPKGYVYASELPRRLQL